MPQNPVQVEVLSSGPDIWVIIAGILGIAGFVISTLTIVRQRRRIKFTLNTAYSLGEGNLKRFICDLTISNLSSLPISIADIGLSAPGEGETRSFPQKFEIRRVTLVSRGTSEDRYLFSDLLPATLQPYSALRILIPFRAAGFTPFGNDYVDRPSDYWYYTAYTPRGNFKGKLSPPSSERLWNANREYPSPNFFDLPKQ